MYICIHVCVCVCTHMPTNIKWSEIFKAKSLKLLNIILKLILFF